MREFIKNTRRAFRTPKNRASPQCSATQESVFEILCHHSGDLENNPLVGCDAVQFVRNVLHASSRYKKRDYSVEGDSTFPQIL